MKRFLSKTVIIFTILWAALPFYASHAQGEAPLDVLKDIPSPQEVVSELPSSPIRNAVLELLRPGELFKKLQDYVRVPLPGTDVKDVEVDKEKVSELNLDISRETGVDLLKFFQFVGKVFVVVLEGTARMIRGFLPGG